MPARPEGIHGEKGLNGRKGIKGTDGLKVFLEQRPARSAQESGPGWRFFPSRRQNGAGDTT